MAVIADLKKYRGVIKCWGREREHVRVRYDFADDGGAAGEYPILKAGEAMIIESCKMVVKTTCTSGGSATVGVGKASDLAGVVAATAVASLTAAAVIFGAAQDASHVMAADDILYMNIGTADLTAGVIDFLIELQKA